jgi:hypothetical protein
VLNNIIYKNGCIVQENFAAGKIGCKLAANWLQIASLIARRKN